MKFAIAALVATLAAAWGENNSYGYKSQPTYGNRSSGRVGRSSGYKSQPSYGGYGDRSSGYGQRSSGYGDRSYGNGYNSKNYGGYGGYDSKAYDLNSQRSLYGLNQAKSQRGLYGLDGAKEQ